MFHHSPQSSKVLNVTPPLPSQHTYIPTAEDSVNWVKRQCWENEAKSQGESLAARGLQFNLPY